MDNILVYGACVAAPPQLFFLVFVLQYGLLSFGIIILFLVLIIVLQVSLSPSMPLFFTALSQFLAVASNFPLAVLVACYAHAAHVQFPAGLFSSWLLSWSLVFAFSVSLMVCSLSLALLLSSKSMWLLLLYG